MNISVERKWFTSKSTVGEMYIDGVFFCFTLEPVTREDDLKPRAIPEGTFPLVLRMSKKFGRIMPHVENVPGFDAIEIHWGNEAKDTEACTLVGRSRGNDYVGSSKLAFEDLFKQLEAYNDAPHTIRYFRSEHAYTYPGE